ncbi:MAG: hypothetical protein K0R87_1849 [Pseudonocardia sp.]|nr:hypothetical protein [Pseudonocardia sp.]
MGDHVDPEHQAVDPQYRYAVGELYHPDVTRWPDGSVQWRLSDQGVELLLFYTDPTDSEVQAIRTGQARFALLPGEHALVLAHCFGDQPWGDAPWQACRQVDAVAGLPIVGAGERLAVTVILVDAATGIVRVLRVVSWPHSLAEAVRHAMRAQARNASTEAQGAAEIESWYRRYPATPDLVRAATLNVRA